MNRRVPLGSSKRARRKRGGFGMLLLLPLLVPALLLASGAALFVLRTLLVVVAEVGAALGALGWVVWPIAAVLLIRMLKRARRSPGPAEESEPSPPPPAAITQPESALAELARRTHVWLGEQARALPVQLQERIRSMQAQLDALMPQLREAGRDALVQSELESLLREELPQLIEAYRKVPRALAQRSLRGGSSPEQQLSAGLATLDAQLGALHERLAAPDLQALAVHQRYLDLKYNPPGSAST